MKNKNVNKLFLSLSLSVSQSIPSFSLSLSLSPPPVSCFLSHPSLSHYTHTHASVLNMRPNNLMVRFEKWWRCGECGVPFNCFVPMSTLVRSGSTCAVTKQKVTEWFIIKTVVGNGNLFNINEIQYSPTTWRRYWLPVSQQITLLVTRPTKHASMAQSLFLVRFGRRTVAQTLLVKCKPKQWGVCLFESMF